MLPQQFQYESLRKGAKGATRLIPEFLDLSFEERLNRLGLTTIKSCRFRGDLLEIFKIMKGYENVTEEMLVF